MITNQNDKASYSGNGSNVNFAIPFTIVVSDVAEVGVILRDITVPASPVDTPQVYGALQNYTLSGANPPGSPFNTTVVMNIAPTSNQILVVYRIMPLTQLLNMVTNNFDYSNLNIVHDRIVAMMQMVNEALGRMPSLAQATQVPPANMSIPEPVANTAIGFNSSKQLVLLAAAAISNAIATLTGDVTSVGGAAAPTIIAPNAVTNAKLAQAPTLTIKGNNTGGTANVLDLTPAQVYAMISSLIPATVIPTNSYATAFHVIGNTWTTTGTSFGSLTHTAGTATLTPRNSSGISLAAAASSLPGILFTPAVASAVYEITATFLDVGDSNFHYYRFSDGTVNFGSATIALAAGAGPLVTLTGIYVPGAATAKTVQIQGAVTSGGTLALNTTNAVLGSSIEWKVVRIA